MALRIRESLNIFKIFCCRKILNVNNSKFYYSSLNIPSTSSSSSTSSIEEEKESTITTTKFMNEAKTRPLTKRPIFSHKPKSTGEPLSFIDFRNVICKAGNGGDGIISFLREFNMEFGGPDGGNGGNGGHVIFKADSKVTDLSHVNNIIQGQNGRSGMSRCCHGKNGEHTFVHVPLNTLIKRPGSIYQDPEEGLLHELIEPNDMFIAARGGAGGHGNNFYLSNSVRKPVKAEFGGKGEQGNYVLEMRVMAAAGLVGFPNAGKSTFLRAISRARPKVASYPFTTLNPHVGMVLYDDFQQIGADIPGLMEGAHKNVGLGFNFLRHVTRCECIIYFLDYTLGEFKKQLNSLKYELTKFNEKLAFKEAFIIINKSDLIKNEEEKDEIQNLFPENKLFFVSAREKLDLEPVLIHIREHHDAQQHQRQQHLLEQQQNAFM